MSTHNIIMFSWRNKKEKYQDTPHICNKDYSKEIYTFPIRMITWIIYADINIYSYSPQSNQYASINNRDVTVLSCKSSFTCPKPTGGYSIYPQISNKHAIHEKTMGDPFQNYLSHIEMKECSLRKHAYSNILNILQPKKENFQIKKFRYFSYFCSKHRLWVPVRTASERRF